VVLLTGCVQDVLYADVNRATADVLLAHGCEVVTPRNQGCCGSLQAHLGDTKVARQLARQMIDSISLDEVDAVVSNAGGCGSHLRHYTALLAGDDHYAERARVWDSKFRDVHEFLHQSGAWAFDSREATRDVASGKRPRRVAYDESCHLKHGQGASQYAAAMLAAIPGIELVPLAEADWCCGSAGVYSLTQPEEAELLAKRKVEHILASGADTVATANPGCQLQLQNALRAAGSSIDVVHTMQLAAAAIRR
jgi:glycolate oxidase iron-sulfur subunit